jgi:hypothetical protein
MATLGYFSHTEPQTTVASAAEKYCSLNGVVGVHGFCGEAGFAFSENIAAGCDGLLCAEAGFVAEGPLGSHFQAVVDSTDIWIGFGESYNGASFDPIRFPGTVNYFVQDFGQR